MFLELGIPEYRHPNPLIPQPTVAIFGPSWPISNFPGKCTLSQRGGPRLRGPAMYATSCYGRPQLSELSSKMVFSHTCRRALTQALFDNPWNGICSFKILEGETRRKRGTCPARPYRDHSSSHTSIGQVIGGDHGTASPPDATRSSSLRPRDAPPCRCSIFAGQATVSPNILAAYS